MQIDNFQNLPIPQSVYEQKVIDFCQKWLTGQLEFVLKTSGSTGEPKPIFLNRNQMIASAKLTGKTFELKRGDSALVCLNVDYIAGMMMLVRGMVLGLKLIVVEPSSNPLELLEDKDFDFAAFVPLQLQTILDSQVNIRIVNGMKAVIVGGAAVNEVLEKKIQELTVPVFSTYGMTETVSHIAVRRMNGVGKSDNFTVLEGVKVGLDERNCLNIIADASNNELIQTNDIVEMLGENTFKLMGRFDNIINSGGVKIQLEKVEKATENDIQMLNPKRYFAYGIPDEKLGQKLVLVLEKDFLDQNEIDSFLKNIGSVLSKYEIPKEILFIEKFLETPTGKVDKRGTIEFVVEK
ncbi:MAG: AMP-binding protein [Bacteroidota bacterium]